MSIKYAMLGILSQGDLHGYELKSSFDERVGEFWSLNYGQIYSTLDRFEKEELVTHDRQEQEKRPDRKIFSITPLGRKDLKMDAGLFHAEADIRWLTLCEEKIRAMSKEG